MGGDRTQFHCFGCNGSGNIFKAVHYLEGKPLAGKEFILDTLLPLAAKYEIPVESTPLTEDEIYELDTYRIYSLASEYITTHTNVEMFQQAISARGWGKEICEEYGIGTVDIYKDFREYLKGFGFSAKFIDDVDLNREEIFSPNNIIFTIRDELGKPVGFAARNLLYTDDKANGPKYNNQRTTGAKCNIYRKGSRLYGFDRLLRRAPDRDTVVYIFEGYGDVVTAAQHGIYNCVSLGGTNFSVDQLNLLKDYNYYNLSLTLDGDEAGYKAIENILDTTFVGQKDIHPYVVIMPDGHDPDTFIRDKGTEEFGFLRRWSGFEWRLAQFGDDIAPEIICQKIIPIIANETSAVVRERMEDTLVSYTGVSKKAIHSDIEQLLSTREAEIARNRQHILDKLKRSIDIDPVNAENLLLEAHSSLYELSKIYGIDNFGEQSYIEAIQNQKTAEESKDGSFSGFILGSDLKPFEQALCGDWKKDTWICIGGRENVGKSALLLKIGYCIAKHLENNAVVLYHSTDDTREQLVPRMVCLAEGSNRLSINQVIDPKYYIKSGKSDARLLEWRDAGYAGVLDLAREGRFVMKDSNDGQTLSYIENLIRYYKDKYPDRHLVYILDNFHKVPDFQNFKSDERVRFKAMSGTIKSLATRYHITIISSVEYTKLQQGTIPTNTNIGETGQIAYDANVICHLYSDLHEYGDKATHFHTQLDEDGTMIKLPRIMVNFGKNKVSPYKGRQWYDFVPYRANFKYVEMSEMNNEQSKEKTPANRFEALALED